MSPDIHGNNLTFHQFCDSYLHVQRNNLWQISQLLIQSVLLLLQTEPKTKQNVPHHGAAAEQVQGYHGNKHGNSVYTYG